MVTAVAPAMPKMNTVMMFMTTVAMLDAATNWLPMRPMMALSTDRPMPHSSSLPVTGRQLRT